MNSTQRFADRRLAKNLHDYATRTNDTLAGKTNTIGAIQKAEIVSYVARVRKLADEIVRLTIESGDAATASE